MMVLQLPFFYIFNHFYNFSLTFHFKLLYVSSLCMGALCALSFSNKSFQSHKFYIFVVHLFSFWSHFTCIYYDVYPRLSVSTTYAPSYLLVSLYVFRGTCKFAHQILLEQHKNLIKDRWLEPSKGRPKKSQKTHNPQEPKKRERASPSHGRKLSHTWPL